jgi:hypothetical protein
MASNHIRRSVFILPLLFSLIVAVNFDSSPPHQSRDPLECQTQRAPDYYGLGVRLGIYFQWISAYIAFTMLPAEIAGSLDTNSIWLFALLVAFIRCSITDMLEQIDGLILLHLSQGTIVSVLSLWGYRSVQYSKEGVTAIQHYGGFGTHCRLFLTLAIQCYSLWFWLFGVTGKLSPMGPEDQPPNDPACGTLYTFMFAKVPALGGIRTWYIIVNICAIVVYGSMAISSTFAGYNRTAKLVRLVKSSAYATSTRLRFATGFTVGELKSIHKFWKIFTPVYIIYSMLKIEFTLNFNHVGMVLGGPGDDEIELPAQMLPLLIGVFSFVRVSWLTWSAHRAEEGSPAIANDGLDGPKPALAADAPQPEMHDGDELDPHFRGRGVFARYFVAMMPWFSLLDHFGANMRAKDEERLFKARPDEPEKSLSVSSTVNSSPMLPRKTHTMASDSSPPPASKDHREAHTWS